MITTLIWVLERKDSDLKPLFLGKNSVSFYLSFKTPSPHSTGPILYLSRPVSTNAAYPRGCNHQDQTTQAEAPGSSHEVCQVSALADLRYQVSGLPALRLRDHPTKETFLNPLNPGKSPSSVRPHGLQGPQHRAPVLPPHPADWSLSPLDCE